MLFENCGSVFKSPYIFLFVSVYGNTGNGFFFITVIISCLPAVLWFFAFCFPFSLPHCIFLGSSCWFQASEKLRKNNIDVANKSVKWHHDNLSCTCTRHKGVNGVNMPPAKWNMSSVKDSIKHVLTSFLHVINDL